MQIAIRQCVKDVLLSHGVSVLVQPLDADYRSIGRVVRVPYGHEPALPWFQFKDAFSYRELFYKTAIGIENVGRALRSRVVGRDWLTSDDP
jgi:hypothetical protein